MFPETRLRRLRNNKQIREMLDISPPYPNKFIWPTFVVPGKNIKEPIKSMPGQYRYSVDMLVNDLGKIVESGIGGVLLFGSTEEENKNAHGHASFDQDGVVQQAIHKIKEKYSSFTVIADICVCAFTDHGHCGTLDKDKLVNNDETLVTLSSMAKSMCDAGVDIVAPSSMMDGQVHAIREKLDSNNYENKIIMSYSTKFASSLYDPFRDAENSQPSSGDRKAYQASYANLDLALRESEFDEYRLIVSEGVYKIGQQEVITPGSVNDYRSYGRAIVYELRNRQGKIAFDQTFRLAAWWKDSQQYERMILDYDTYNRDGSLNVQIIVIMPELSTFGYTANYTNKLETRYNNYVQATGELIEILG